MWNREGKQSNTKLEKCQCNLKLSINIWTHQLNNLVADVSNKSNNIYHTLKDDGVTGGWHPVKKPVARQIFRVDIRWGCSWSDHIYRRQSTESCSQRPESADNADHHQYLLDLDFGHLRLTSGVPPSSCFGNFFGLSILFFIQNNSSDQNKFCK